MITRNLLSTNAWGLELIQGIIQNDRKVLAQAITLLESNHPDDKELSKKILNNLPKVSNDPIRIGICGSPGVGKSSLIEALGKAILGKNEENDTRLAVLAYDPTSVVAGGSLLGDKARMTYLSSNQRCFIRPTPTGADGAINRSSLDTLTLIKHAGYDAVIIETVGSGQADVSIRDLVDVLIYAVAPFSGDWLQAMKRGISEVADILLITKSDVNIHAAKMTLRELSSHVKLAPLKPSVMAVSASENIGIKELWREITDKFLLVKQDLTG
jgi:LAO/AO transport system kinase